MAAEQNSDEAFAALARVLRKQKDQTRAVKDYLMMSSTRLKSYQVSLNQTCLFDEMTDVSNYIREEFKTGVKLVVPIPGVSGFILFRLKLVNNPQSTVLKETLLFPHIAEVYHRVKGCNPEPEVGWMSNQAMMKNIDFNRSVQNIIFIQNADNFHGKNNNDVRIDPGVTMDAKAVNDPRIFPKVIP